MQRFEGLGVGGRAELKLSLLLTRWPQVHLWGMRYKLRAEQLLGPLLTSAAAAPSFPGKDMEIALIFQEQRGQLTDLASFLPPYSAPHLGLVI